MLTLLGLDQLSQAELMLTGLAAIIGATVAGWIGEATMGQASFGVVGNGILAVLGMACGLASWKLMGIPLIHQDASSIILLATGSSSAILFAFGAMKRVM